MNDRKAAAEDTGGVGVSQQRDVPGSPEDITRFAIDAAVWAWSKTELGLQIDTLIREPYALSLRQWLRNRNGPNATFMIANLKNAIRQ